MERISHPRDPGGVPAISTVNSHPPEARSIPQRFPATVQDLFNHVGRLYHDAQIRWVVRMAGASMPSGWPRRSG